jgi:hypothetical protein
MVVGQKADLLALSPLQRSRTKSWSESQVADIEFADFKAAEIHAIEVSFDLFESDVFTTKDLTDKDAALVPTDIACIVHSSNLEVN